MGCEVNFYLNSYNSFHKWLEQVYPAYFNWALTCAQLTEEAEVSLPWGLTSLLLRTLEKIGPVWPNEATLQNFYLQSELIVLVNHITHTFCAFIDEYFDLELLPMHDFLSNFAPYHFRVLGHFLREPLQREEFAVLVEHVYGRLYKFTSNFAMGLENKTEMGFWTYQECLLLQDLLPCFFDTKLPQYIYFEAQIRANILSDDDCFENRDPDDVFKDIRESCLKLYQVFQLLPEKNGLFICFSY